MIRLPFFQRITASIGLPESKHPMPGQSGSRGETGHRPALSLVEWLLQGDAKMIGISTNATALTAQNNLSATARHSLGLNTAHLSSGLRFTRDNDTTLSITAGRAAKIDSQDQTSREANDAITMMQVASGFLGQISSSLQDLRHLASQATATVSAYDPSDRAVLNAMAQDVIAGIDRFAGSANYNGIKLLDGTFGTIEIGASATTSGQIDIPSIASVQSSALGASGEAGAPGGDEQGGATTIASVINATVGAAAAGLAVGSTNATGTVVSLSSIDLTTIDGAKAALTTIDAAINSVGDSRVQLAATENLISAVLDKRRSDAGRLAAPSIRDADHAAEAASLVRNQLLQTPDIAYLSQANAAPQRVLSLLR